MLYIVTSDGKEKIWHVGNSVPDVAPLDVVEIQADCHELEHVKKICIGIPLSNRAVVSWRDHYARFIYRMLRQQ